MAEGPQSVREVLRFAPRTVDTVYYVRGPRSAELVELATGQQVATRECTPEVLAAMCEAQHPQPVVAVVRPVDVPLPEALAGEGFVVVLTNVRDPGNAGTVIRGADAAGARCVLISDSSVDIQNPKVVRSTAGSLWHLPIHTGSSIEEIFTACGEAGLLLLAADGVGEQLLPDTDLTRPHAWVMGNEAWGLEPEIRDACDEVVRVPIYGQAESLNLAMAATICLYASAGVLRP
ncbi:RNA methyltransferase [Calidifontibacter terrae]